MKLPLQLTSSDLSWQSSLPSHLSPQTHVKSLHLSLSTGLLKQHYYIIYSSLIKLKTLRQHVWTVSIITLPNVDYCNIFCTKTIPCHKQKILSLLLKACLYWNNKHIKLASENIEHWTFTSSLHILVRLLLKHD
jgi:hypothetical protein